MNSPAARKAFDLKSEPEHVHKLYGTDTGTDLKKDYAKNCILARRLLERGVRVVQLFNGSDAQANGISNWDSHADMLAHEKHAKNVDQPIAGLLRDLKQRGMLNDTLVVWTTEFGRTPFNNTADNKGREHHDWAFSSWLAGAGVKPGIVYGATDEIGLRVADNPVHVRDFHATILHLMGLDHEQLTYRHAGLDFRLTGVEESHVVKGVLT